MFVLELKAGGYGRVFCLLSLHLERQGRSGTSARKDLSRDDCIQERGRHLDMSVELREMLSNPKVVAKALQAVYKPCWALLIYGQLPTQVPPEHWTSSSPQEGSSALGVLFPTRREKQSHASGQAGDLLWRKSTESSGEGHLDVLLGLISPVQTHANNTFLAPGLSALAVCLVMAPGHLPDLAGG